MSIAPISHTVEVRTSPARAFELFTAQMGRWWPSGKTIGRNPFAEIVIEPREGGRWYERDERGSETQWGRVLAWEPPSRVLPAWQINTQWRYDPGLVTEVELTFEGLTGGGTRMRLEHRNLERLGTDAEAHAAQLRGGWPAVVGYFASYTDSHR